MKRAVTVTVILDTESKKSEEELAAELASSLEDWGKAPLFTTTDGDEVFVDAATHY